MKILREYDKSGPKIKGNFTQLQEVLFNIIDNSFDAIVQRQNDLMEPNFLGRLEVYVNREDDHVEFVFCDNRIGV